MANAELLYDKFHDEYVSEDAVRKYTTETAGYGISYLLAHDYARIYLNAVASYLRTTPQRPLRLLEFGCGAGMNVTRLVSLLEKQGFSVERAYGTDFSPRLVKAAQQEAKTFLSAHTAEKVSFHVAHNEKLVDDLAMSLGEKANLVGSLDLVLGVNTFRYCHRLGSGLDCAKDIYRLLRSGGVCINIDMNDRFPAFRSRLRGQERNREEECYLPSLEEYAAPFRAAGFQITKKGNFCWIPHSAGRDLTFACRVAAPLLNLVARGRAMRSLVIARKPA
jgi:SAM-dependent methyltransferase